MGSGVNSTIAAGKWVLLVEDDASLEPIWRLILALLANVPSLNWVTSAEAAERAIWKKKAEGLNYDLVITDIFLSGYKTGVDLWRANQSEKTAFVFASALSLAQFEKFFAQESSCPPFIAKPINPTLCLATLKDILSDS